MRLKKLIREYRTEQRSVLPPERELALKLDVSRMTLRKAMEMAAMQGIIQRENKVTSIRLAEHDLSPCGKIVFVATGHYGMIAIPVLERIFLKMQSELRKYNTELQLLLLPFRSNGINIKEEKERFRKTVEEAGVVFFTVKDSFILHDPDILKMIHQYEQQGNRRFVRLSIDGTYLCSDFIMLDDREVGRMAAKLFYLAGAKNVATAWTSGLIGYTHKIRIAFFEKYCAGYGIRTHNFLNYDDDPKYRSRITDKLILDKFDGFFLTSDESIDSAVRTLTQRKNIPAEFKILTVNSSGRAIGHLPPITALGHGVDEIVRKAVDFLVAHAEGIAPEHVREYIKPEIFYNGTLSYDEYNWSTEI